MEQEEEDPVKGPARSVLDAGVVAKSVTYTEATTATESGCAKPRWWLVELSRMRTDQQSVARETNPYGRGSLALAIPAPTVCRASQIGKGRHNGITG